MIHEKLSSLLRSQDLHERRAVFQPIRLRHEEINSGDALPSSSVQRRYRLSAVLNIDYWTSPSNQAEAEKAARRQLMTHLYSDVLCDFAELRLRIVEMDTRLATEILDRIDRRLRGAR